MTDQSMQQPAATGDDPQDDDNFHEECGVFGDLERQ